MEEKRSIWTGFYKKTLKERQCQLKLAFPHLFESAELSSLDDAIADNMVENCIGSLGLPCGLALNMVLDNKEIVVPMAIEEPSVIAAVSSAAKTISKFGLFSVVPSRNIVTAQILLGKVNQDIKTMFSDCEEELKTIANTFCLGMLRRGGGVLSVELREIIKSSHDEETSMFLQRNGVDGTSWFVVHLNIDVCDSMGANCASTVAEGVSDYLTQKLNTTARVRIVSNLSTNRLTTVSFKVPIKTLEYKNFSGEQVCAGVLECYLWAMDDEYRAATHNKGIMNGIDAVAIACGQDWRAIESACYSFTKAKPMTKYFVKNNMFCGEITLPLMVGTRGGVVKTHKLYSLMLGIMDYPNSKQLAAIMCAIGLLQNFAALRALSTEGIQKGHMSLHARNIAIAAGAPTHAVSEIAFWMKEQNQITIQSAREYLVAHHLYSKLSVKCKDSKILDLPPSIFYFKHPIKDIHLHVAFPTLRKPIYLDFADQTNLMFEKPIEWFKNTLFVLKRIQLMFPRANQVLCERLKLLSLILNLCLRRLFVFCPLETRDFVNKVLTKKTNDCCSFVHFNSLNLQNNLDLNDFNVECNLFTDNLFDSNDELMEIGLPLCLAIWQVFELWIEQNVGHSVLAKAIREEQALIVATICSETTNDFDFMFHVLAKRSQCTLFLLIDLVCLEPNFVTEYLLLGIKKLGFYLEQEVSAAHDIARLPRDYELNTRNSLLTYAFLQNVQSKQGILNLKQNYLDEINLPKKRKQIATHLLLLSQKCCSNILDQFTEETLESMAESLRKEFN